MASFAEKSRALIEALAALELIAAFEGGEDRESVLKRARRLRSEPAPDRWDGLPYGLVTRLMQDRDGADVVIPTRVGDDLNVAYWAGWFAAVHSYSFLLLVFDEQIAVLCVSCSNTNADFPPSVICCSRSSAFENCFPKQHHYRRGAYRRRLRAWYQSPDSSIPVVTPTRVSCMGSGSGTLFQVERQAKFMGHIEALCQECGTHGLVACAGEFRTGSRLGDLALEFFDDDAGRAQAAFQDILLKLYVTMHIYASLRHDDDLPPVGAFRRRAVRGLLARLRALVQQGRAACLRDGFLYEVAPAGVFRLVVSFL